MEHIRVTTLWWLCALAAAATVGYYMGYAQANKLPSIVLKSPRPQTQKNGVPARVFVISMPKTACGSTATAIHKWFVDRGTKSEERVFGCHFPHTPDCRAIPQLNCTPADWCLIVSGHRKLGAELISLFFHTKCGDAGPESPQCRELQGMSDQVLRDNIVKFMQRAMFNPSHRYSWWLHAMLTFHRAGLNFSLNDLVQHGVTELPNALWVVLPFEAGWKMRENILGKWLPGVNLSRDISHKRKVYLQQHDRMLEAFQNESFWPEDIRTALLQSDTMTFFYNTSVPA
ncbi:hypothetical protein AK812_SmicGene43448 [Symbiodinium microadriaticum]|uniref:Uncharacterized protein n=1 Tax=Symbiodinium microadriaticum TaxID=2951 RepID=A0A1Q9C111_SYMMI|nr:hypothetical protein AK812_SmicGene43448 [Symbiodinium microadriaticum]CAE7592107.1 unnamed protein product [Symbiodinium sp. KB8]CAE7864869.1 unnamed protein product [Symbiodinium microadriaticum]